MRVRNKQAVIDAVLSGLCNTSRDVSDETGLTVKACSKCIHKLVSDGILRQTDRWLADGRFKMRVFEVVT